MAVKAAAGSRHVTIRPAFFDSELWMIGEGSAGERLCAGVGAGSSRPPLCLQDPVMAVQTDDRPAPRGRSARASASGCWARAALRRPVIIALVLGGPALDRPKRLDNNVQTATGISHLVSHLPGLSTSRDRRLGGARGARRRPGACRIGWWRSTGQRTVRAIRRPACGALGLLPLVWPAGACRAALRS